MRRRTAAPRALSGRAHPSEDSLRRFLLGGAARAEARAIVLHLLEGCPECLAVTRPAWLGAEESRGREMNERGEVQRHITGEQPHGKPA
jgi:hypothetical protein